MKKAHEVEYVIHGDDMQFVEVILDPQETVIAEAGGMMMMEDGIKMETKFGSNSSGGMLGKLAGAAKRTITGESLFMTEYTNTVPGKKSVSFAASYPGKIIPLHVEEFGGKIICQKDAFLCAAKGMEIGIEFQKKLGAGFFGGEGFIMQKIEGDGLAFIHAGGTVYERVLHPGEKLRIDTGCLVALTGDVKYDIEYVGSVKTAIFGGEGLFYATLQGPGKVWVQSLTLSRMAQRIVAASGVVGRKEEGSILGAFGNMLDGK